MIFDAIINFLEACLYGAFFWRISDKNRMKKVIGLVIYIPVHFLLFSYVNASSIMTGNLSVIIYLLAYLFLTIGSDYSPQEKLFFSIIPDLDTAVINTYLILFSSYFWLGKIDVLQMLEHHGTSVTLISKVLQFFCFRYSAEILNQKKDYLDRKEFLLAAGIGFLCLTIFNSIEELLFYQRFDGTKIAIAVLCLGALVVLSGIEIMLAVKRNQKIREQQKINDMISLQLRNTKENIRVSEALSRIKHDIRHMVSLLADSGVSDETIRAYEQELNSAEVPIQTGSQILNYILQTEQERAAVKGIHLHCMLNITSKPFLSEEDLIVLVMNSLDNAIQHISNGNEIKITLKSNAEVFFD